MGKAQVEGFKCVRELEEEDLVILKQQVIQKIG